MSAAAAGTRPALVFLYLTLLVLIGFFAVPGHTYLQADTQIFVPILERIENPGLYSRDFLLDYSHVSLTIYDEASIALRRLLHSGFEIALAGEQILFRIAALWGIFLIASSVGIHRNAAFVAAAAFGLGATITGPAVLSVEYEPVARGYSLAMALLAAGLVLHDKFTWASVAVTVGFLFQPPAIIPFAAIFVPLILIRRHWRALVPPAAGAVVLAITASLQRGVKHPQPFWLQIDPEWEKIIRFRTAYDWVDQWPAGAITVFLVYAVVAFGAFYHIRRRLTVLHRVLLLGLPLIGILSIPLSSLLLDHFKWALMCQVQPARATLYIVVFAQINCALAAGVAIGDGRRREGWAWLIPSVLPCVIQNVQLLPNWRQALAVLALAGIATLLLALPRRIAWTAALGLTLAAGWIVTDFAGTQNYPRLHSPELDQLSDWARANTPESSLFQFANSGRSLEQGVFRAKSLRGLYVDWKAGGQVNYFREFALEWWKRWRELDSGGLSQKDWRTRGVDYLIYSGARQVEPGQPPAFENGRFRVYKLVD